MTAQRISRSLLSCPSFRFVPELAAGFRWRPTSYLKVDPLSRPNNFSEDHLGQTEPRGEPVELKSESFDCFRGSIRFERHPVNLQQGRTSVGFDVHPRDESFIQQERQDIVTVGSTALRHVDLDPVMKAKQPFCAISLPDESVERR